MRKDSETVYVPSKKIREGAANLISNFIAERMNLMSEDAKAHVDKELEAKELTRFDIDQLIGDDNASIRNIEQARADMWRLVELVQRIATDPKPIISGDELTFLAGDSDKRKAQREQRDYEVEETMKRARKSAKKKYPENGGDNYQAELFLERQERTARLAAQNTFLPTAAEGAIRTFVKYHADKGEKLLEQAADNDTPVNQKLLRQHDNTAGALYAFNDFVREMRQELEAELAKKAAVGKSA